MEKLKAKWGLTSNFQIIIILIVFAINGSFAAWAAKPITQFFDLSPDNMNTYVYWTLRILLIFPVYQLTLPLVGFIFGQFRFFWKFEKQFLKRLGLGFLFKTK